MSFLSALEFDLPPPPQNRSSHFFFSLSNRHPCVESLSLNNVERSMFEVWLFESVIRERATSERLRNTLMSKESRGRVRAVSNKRELG